MRKLFARPRTVSMLFLLAALMALAASAQERPYTIVDTAQVACYDNAQVIQCPAAGQPFYGQDAEVDGTQPNYTVSADGLTVYDNNTGLTWQKSPDTNGDGVLNSDDKLTWAQAQGWPAVLNAASYGGFSDWRLPTIKELYSLFDCRGTDPSGYSGTDTSGLTPFIDTRFFKFAYGDTARGERIIDSQYASCTKYVGKSPRGGVDKLFGVNFADGRIKGYDLQMPGGMEKRFFVQCVRGNPQYGTNDFHDNADGTVTDRATGLIWSRADSGRGMDWQVALAWVQKQNAESYLGRSDWRMPNVKELQSIVDYTRAPDVTHSPAIAPVFDCTQITNEGGTADYPCYWSSTTHAGFMGGGAAMYVAFGRAAGWLSARALAGGPPDRRGGPPGPSGGFGRGGPGAGGSPPMGEPKADAGDYNFTDVHGAGAQRSDPKAGDPRNFPHGRGPQGDVIRIYNFVRLVRGGLGEERSSGDQKELGVSPASGFGRHSQKLQAADSHAGAPPRLAPRENSKPDSNVEPSRTSADDSAAPAVTGVTALSNPLRLMISGEAFQEGCTILIGGKPVPNAVLRGSRLAVASGVGLEKLMPQGVTVQITVVSADGRASAPFAFTR